MTLPVHLERAGNQLLAEAGPDIARRLGPAARVAEAGPLPAHMAQNLAPLTGRAKAVHLMGPGFAARDVARLGAAFPEAEIRLERADPTSRPWNWPPMAVGRSLVCVGGGYGLWPVARAQGFWQRAAAALAPGDMALVLLETPVDPAWLEAMWTPLVDHVSLGQGRRRPRAPTGEMPARPLAFHDPGRGAVRFGHSSPEGFVETGAARQLQPRDLAESAAGFTLEAVWTAAAAPAALCLLTRA